MDATERRDRATDEASQWWSRIGLQPEESISDADRAEFTRWLRESPVHVAEILHVAHVHDALARFSRWQSVAVEGMAGDNIVPLPSSKRSPGRPGSSDGGGRTPARWMLAAGLGALAVAAAALFARLDSHSLSTGRAERREVMLADGSIVKLEPQTLLHVRLESQQRRVTMERGRALFHVVKDRTRPFLVVADDTTMRAVGTAFAVERGDHDVVVTVSEGKVAVRTQQDLANVDPSVRAGEPRMESEVLLVAGQQLTVQHSGRARAPRAVDTKRELAWAEGRLVFDSAPLGEVVAEFNRYNHVQLHVADELLASRPVSGVFQASDPQTLISFIRAGARVNVVQEGNGQRIVIAPASR
jgi:transmembrane sensor